MLNKDINLLPIYIINARENRRKSRFIIFSLVSTIIIAFIITIILYNSIYQLKVEKNELQQNIDQYTDEIKDVKTVEGQQNKTVQLQKVLLKIKEQEYNTSLFLKLFEDETPKEVIVDSIVVLANEISINGTAPDEEIIANLIYNIKRFDIIENVHIANINDSSKGNKGFILRCIMKKGKDISL